MIVNLVAVKAHLNITFDTDDALIGAKIASAQSIIEAQLGYAIEDRYGGEGLPAIPQALTEAVLQVVGHLYENREAVLVGVSGQALPLGVEETIRNFRDWSF